VHPVPSCNITHQPSFRIITKPCKYERANCVIQLKKPMLCNSHHLPTQKSQDHTFGNCCTGQEQEERS
jgi:hypothetical protein